MIATVIFKTAMPSAVINDVEQVRTGGDVVVIVRMTGSHQEFPRADVREVHLT